MAKKKPEPASPDTTALPAVTVPPLSAEVLDTIRGYASINRELAAYRTYREAVVALGQEEPSLDEAQDVVRVIVAQEPPPADWEPPGAEVEEVRPELRAVHPAEDDGEEGGRVVAEIQPPRGKVVVRVTSQDVAFDLADAELLERSARLAKLGMDIATEKITQVAARRKMRETLSQMEGERARLDGVVYEKREVRATSVTHEVDYDAGVVREILPDGRVLQERPLDPKERQVPLLRPVVEREDDEDDGEVF